MVYYLYEQIKKTMNLRNKNRDTESLQSFYNVHHSSSGLIMCNEGVSLFPNLGGAMPPLLHTCIIGVCFVICL